MFCVSIVQSCLFCPWKGFGTGNRDSERRNRKFPAWDGKTGKIPKRQKWDSFVVDALLISISVPNTYFLFCWGLSPSEACSYGGINYSRYNFASSSMSSSRHPRIWAQVWASSESLGLSFHNSECEPLVPAGVAVHQSCSGAMVPSSAPLASSYLTTNGRGTYCSFAAAVNKPTG